MSLNGPYCSAPSDHYEIFSKFVVWIRISCRFFGARCFGHSNFAFKSLWWNSHLLDFTLIFFYTSLSFFSVLNSISLESKKKNIPGLWMMFYWVLLGFTGFYWVLLGFTEFDRGMPCRFSIWLKDHQVFHNVNRVDWILTGFSFVFFSDFDRIRLNLLAVGLFFLLAFTGSCGFLGHCAALNRWVTGFPTTSAPFCHRSRPGYESGSGGNTMAQRPDSDVVPCRSKSKNENKNGETKDHRHLRRRARTGLFYRVWPIEAHPSLEGNQSLEMKTRRSIDAKPTETSTP